MNTECQPTVYMNNKKYLLIQHLGDKILLSYPNKMNGLQLFFLRNAQMPEIVGNFHATNILKLSSNLLRKVYSEY